MNYLSAWLFSIGLGTGSLHTDFNKFPLSRPGMNSEISVISCFGQKYIGAKIAYQSNTILISDWAVRSEKKGGRSFRISNYKTSFFIGGELFSNKRFGRLSLFMGLSFINDVGLGINSSMMWKIPNRRKNHNYFYFCKIETSYWGSDLMDNYKDQKNQFGDIDVSLNVGIQVPLYLTNKRN